jgi:hypothetical protein
MNKKPTSLALSIIVLQFITWMNIIIFVLLFGYFIYGLTIEPELAMMSMMLSGKLLGAFGGLFLAILLHFTSKGLLKQKKWARIVTMILGILMLFGFPIGTIIGVLLIYGTTKGWPEQQTETTNKNEETNNLP